MAMEDKVTVYVQDINPVTQPLRRTTGKLPFTELQKTPLVDFPI